MPTHPLSLVFYRAHASARVYGLRALKSVSGRMLCMQTLDSGIITTGIKAGEGECIRKERG